MKNGVRQGGISPFLFRVYIKDVVLKLIGTGYGCNIGGIVNLLCYADDMVLIIPSWSALQDMLNMLETEAAAINMSCNSKKTVVWYLVQLTDES